MTDPIADPADEPEGPGPTEPPAAEAPAADQPGAPPRGQARELEAAVRAAAAEAVARALDEVSGAVARMDAREAEARDRLVAAAMALPDRVAPVVEGAIRQALRDERDALSDAAERGFASAAARLDAAVRAFSIQAKIEAAGGDPGQAMLARVAEEWKASVGEALSGALVPHGGALAKVAARVAAMDTNVAGVAERVASVDERLGDLETLMRMQGDALAALGRKLDAAPRPAASGDEGAVLKAVAALAAEQRAVGEKLDARAGVAELATKAMRSHLKAATRAEKEHAERIGGMSRHVESIAGRLAFTVEALSGHASLIERLRNTTRIQNVLATANFVAALLIFVAVFLDRFWYLLR